MKKLMYCFIFTLSLFLININVYARQEEGAGEGVFEYFNSNYLELSCIYGDGKVVTRSYDGFLQTQYANISEYPTANFYKLNHTTTGYRLYTHALNDTKNNFTTGYIQYKCPNNIRRYLLAEYDATTSSVINNIIYVFVWEYYLGANRYGVYNQITADTRSGWDQFWGVDSDKVPVTIDLTPDDPDSVSDLVPLVAERITLNKGFSGTKTCSYVHKSKQATGSDAYIDLNYYNDDAFYIDNGTDVTSFASTNADIKNAVKGSTCETAVPCICYKESKKEQSSGEGKTEYIFSQARHSVTKGNKSATGTCSCSSSEEIAYSFSGYSSQSTSQGGIVQVCATIPETAKIIAKIIQYAQIVVPMIVILYSAIDIGKIVVAGNIDEELPKRKKGLIIRGVVMISFIFLPLFIKVLFSTVFDDNFLGVGGIDCLFDDGIWADQDLVDQYDGQYGTTE